MKWRRDGTDRVRERKGSTMEVAHPLVLAYNVSCSGMSRLCLQFLLKIVTRCLTVSGSISKTAGDTNSVTMDNL